MNTSILIAAIVVAVVILILINLVNKPIPKGIDKEHFVNEWKDILYLAADQKSRPLSLVHADKLLDEALKCQGFKGETMAERLVSAKGRLSNKEDIWKAHKLRNRVVHETAYEPSAQQVQESLKAYNKAFKSLGVW